jgi:hypothetical protein
LNIVRILEKVRENKREIGERGKKNEKERGEREENEREIEGDIHPLRGKNSTWGGGGLLPRRS